MFTMNETELWRRRRDELMREAEQQRLGRAQRASRAENASYVRRPLLARLRDALHVVPRKETDIADCRD